MKGPRKDEERKVLVRNRKARHEYHFDEVHEAGLALVGSEVKSLRDGKAQLNESFARVERGELILHNAHIDPYAKAAIVYNHEPRRERKLLAKKREIRKLEAESQQRGVTLIPLAIYFKDGRAKVEIGVARGKQQHDKRETIKRKEAERELRRATMQRR